jgi:hypothetical protein
MIQSVLAEHVFVALNDFKDGFETSPFAARSTTLQSAAT